MLVVAEIRGGRRRDHPGLYSVYCDALAGQLECCRPDEPIETGLRRGVVRKTRVGYSRSGHGRGDQDAAPARTAEHGERGLCQPERGLQVDGERALEQGRVNVHERPQRIMRRVVNQDIQAAEIAGRLGHQTQDFSAVRQVGHDCLRNPASAHDVATGRLALDHRLICDHDGCAVSGQRHGDCAADPPTSPRHDALATVQIERQARGGKRGLVHFPVTG